MFAALAQLGAVFAPLNARASVTELVPVAQYARPRVLLAGASHAAAAAELATAAGIVCSPALPDSGADAPPITTDDLDERDPHVIFFTSGSTGRPKGVILSHRANWLRTYVGATTSSGGAGTVCMFPLFHMAGWTIALGAWQGRRPVHFVRTPDAATLLATVERHRASRLYCIPAVWARVLEHGVEQLRPLDPDRGRHRHLGHAARVVARDQGRTPEHCDARVLRLDRSRARCATRRRRLGAQARECRCRATRRRGPARSVGRGLHAQPVPDGRLLRRSRRDERGARATGGTSPATSARSTTRAICRSSAGHATSSAPAARPLRRWRSSR